jgi:hypothetical protein
LIHLSQPEPRRGKLATSWQPVGNKLELLETGVQRDR